MCVAQFIDELKTQPYNSVLIITSQWVIYAAIALIENIPNEDAWKLAIDKA
jgi:broad specificity phosphatase PhoE